MARPPTPADARRRPPMPADALCKNVLIPTISIRLVIDQMSEVTPSTIIITCTFNCVYIMLAVDDQTTLLGITGHNIRGDTEWECVKVYLIRRSHFAIPGRDGPVILEQRHRSCLLIRVKTPVKQSKLIEKPATTNNE